MRAARARWRQHERLREGRCLVRHRLPLVLHRQAQVRGRRRRVRRLDGPRRRGRVPLLRARPTPPSTSRATRSTSSRATRACPSTRRSRCSTRSPTSPPASGSTTTSSAMHHTNTVKAHQVIHLAKAARQAARDDRAPVRRLLRARRARRTESTSLADLAAEIGLDRDEVLSTLRDDAAARRGPRRPGPGAGVRHQRRAVLRARRQVRRLGRPGPARRSSRCSARWSRSARPRRRRSPRRPSAPRTTRARTWR